MKPYGRRGKAEDICGFGCFRRHDNPKFRTDHRRVEKVKKSSERFKSKRALAALFQFRPPEVVQE